jgi:hypothetical protein
MVLALVIQWPGNEALACAIIPTSKDPVSVQVDQGGEDENGIEYKHGPPLLDLIRVP